MAEVRLEGISKTFNTVTAVTEIDLHVREKEFLCILGPSGCGKTTTLRMIAGFEKPDSGQIWIGGRNVTYSPPFRRDTGMVFQSYALFPHMSVRRNVAFGLRMRKVPTTESDRRVAEMLALVGLHDKMDRFPNELSGGEQQRVALARVLAIRPSVILFDEPLSNLDAKLRKEMRLEIRRLQHETGTTAVYVTHDQEEAMAIADRIVVMKGGHIEQIGSPEVVYDRPQTRFVAEFMGSSNVLEATVSRLEGNHVEGRIGDCVLFRAPLQGDYENKLYPGSRLLVVIKSERIRLVKKVVEDQAHVNCSQVSVQSSVRIGPWLHSLVHLPNNCGPLEIATPSSLVREPIRPGSVLYAEWNEDDCVLVPL